MLEFPTPYDFSSITDKLLQQNSLIVGDHIGGFDQFKNNTILNKLNQLAHDHSAKFNIFYVGILTDDIKKKYENLNILFSFDIQNNRCWELLKNYNTHPLKTYKNFVCSFNGSEHVSRKLLVSILEKFRWFNPDYCSKNFSYSTDILDGHIYD